MKKQNVRPILSKNVALFIGGGSALIVGVALILAWWADVIILFRGALGILLALGGLVLLYLIKE